MDRELQNLLSIHGQEELAYKDKFLGDENIQFLCEKLKVDTKKKLILRGNYISTVGAKAIAELIRDQHSLIHLSLEWNQIGSTGAEYFGDALLQNRSLVYLDLRNNYIASDAAIALSTAILKNPSLRTLDLRWNQIEDRGALSFKSCILDRKPSLQLLIQGNLLSEATIATINEWLKNGQENSVEADFSHLKLKLNEEPPRNVTVELLQKEIYQLRQQILTYQSDLNDLRRQLDNSSMRITELEQHLSHEKHENLTLSETIRQLNLRISMQNDELLALTSNFEKERNSIVNEMLRIIRDKEIEIRDLSLERDLFKDKNSKLTDENDQLRVQYENIQQQLATDRAITQNELQLAHHRINEFTIAETKLKAENTSLKTTNARNLEKIAMLKEELDITRKEKDRLIQQEHDHYMKEIEKLKAEHFALMSSLHEKNLQQAEEIQKLQALIATLRGELIKQRKELEDAYEQAIKEAREMERQKSEQTINELRQRIEALNTARNELEYRCDQYVREIQKLQDEHRQSIQSLQYQLQTLQEELQRLRNQNHSLGLSNQQLENQKQTLEMMQKETQKKLMSSEEKIQQLNKELQSLLLTKQSLQHNYDQLLIQYEKLKEGRLREFQLLNQNIITAVQNEFDTMKIHFQIPNNK